MKRMLFQLYQKILKEWLFVGAASALLISTLWFRKLPRYDRKDAEILFILFTFLALIQGLEKNAFFEWVSGKVTKGKHLPVKLVAVTGLLSMVVTNDVALLIMVPLTLRIRTSHKDLLLILEALAANAGSSLTPFGNPQNLFIYWHYHLHPLAFFQTIAPFGLFFMGLLLGIALKVKNDLQDDPSWNSKLQKPAWIYFAYLLVLILTVLKILPLWANTPAIVYMLVKDRSNLRVDYVLLGTFFCFFGLTDNLADVIRIPYHDPEHVFLVSAVSSQIISNVPAALLVSDFTVHWKALLWGVSVGGFGNLVGSLANLIVYRLYLTEAEDPRRFLFRFHLLGYAFFALGGAVYFAWDALVGMG